MFPSLAECDINYVCPEIDDERNPVVLPDRFDCSRYFVCFRGSPIARQCAAGLWFDIRNSWCTTADEVECDARTPNNPNVPTQTPPTTEEITTGLPPTAEPVDPPILDSCYQIRDLFDEENGEYLKSFCTFNRILNYEESELTCRNHNMELFVINNATVESAFHEATTESLIVHPNGFVWINGQRDSTEEWFTFNPNRAPLFDGITWVRTETIDGRTSGDCLRYSSVHGPYQAMGVDCSASSYFTCEFHQV